MDIKTPFIWKNGEMIEWDNALDHNLTHTLHYGGGVFEGIRFYNTPDGPKIFKLKEHIDRLYYSASVFEMTIPYSPEEIKNACLEVVKKSGEKAGYIRPIVYYGYGKMGLNPRGAKVDTTISVWKWGRYLGDNPINVVIPKTRRIDPATTDMSAKVCGNYANSILVSLEISKAGYDEGLLLDTSGYIAEGPGENIFFVKGDKAYTPKLGTILPGITRATIIDIFKDKFNIEVIEEKISPDRLNEFDEAFFVGTAAEVTFIGSITDQQGKKVNYSQNVSKQIHTYYMDIVSGKDPDYIQHLS